MTYMKLLYNQVAANAEADVGASARRILLMEDDAEKSENRLAASIRYLSLFTACPGSLVQAVLFIYQILLCLLHVHEGLFIYQVLSLFNVCPRSLVHLSGICPCLLHVQEVLYIYKVLFLFTVCPGCCP